MIHQCFEKTLIIVINGKTLKKTFFHCKALKRPFLRRAVGLSNLGQKKERKKNPLTKISFKKLLRPKKRICWGNFSPGGGGGGRRRSVTWTPRVVSCKGCFLASDDLINAKAEITARLPNEKHDNGIWELLPDSVSCAGGKQMRGETVCQNDNLSNSLQPYLTTTAFMSKKNYYVLHFLLPLTIPLR